MALSFHDMVACERPTIAGRSRACPSAFRMRVYTALSLAEERRMATHRIAVLPGDGIGKEVMPEGVRVVEAAARKFDIDLKFTSYDWSCDYYAKHGKMMPDDWFDQLKPYECIYYGAVGWPATVPDHVSLWGSLILFRRHFDQYVNMRPCKLM